MAKRGTRPPAGSGVVLKLPRLEKIAKDPRSFRKHLFDAIARRSRPHFAKSQYKRFCVGAHAALRRYEARCRLTRLDPPSRPPEPASHAKSTRRLATVAKAATKLREAFGSLTRLDRGLLDHELFAFGHVDTSEHFTHHVAAIEGAAARAAAADTAGQIGTDPARMLASDVAALFDENGLPIGAGPDSPFVRLLQIASHYTSEPIADARYLAKEIRQKTDAE